MNIIQKQGVHATTINYLGVIVAYLNLIFVFPYFLDLETIGLFRLILEIATLGALIFQLGVPSVVNRFFPIFKDNSLHIRAFYTVMLTLGTSGICILFIFYSIFREPILEYFIERSPLINDFEITFLLISACMILFNIMDRIFTSQKLIVIPVFFRELVYRISLTIIVLLIGLNLISVEISVRIWVLFYFISILSIFFIYKKKFGLRFSFHKKVWCKDELIKFSKHSTVVTLGSIGAGLSVKIDMLMTGSMLGLTELGIYATMVYLATVIEIPKRALTQISDPFISEYISEKNFKKINKLYKKNSLVLILVGVLIFFLVNSNLSYLFEIMPKGESFKIGIVSFGIISIVKLIGLLSSISNQIIVNSEHAWVSSLSVFILAAMAIGLNMIFIPKYGMNGAAFATLLAVGINHTLIMLYTYIKFRVHPFSWSMLWLGLIALGIGFGTYFIPEFSNPFIGILMNSILIVAVYCSIVFKLNISPDANQMALDLIRKGQNFLKKS
jgi:O-antigen/teichoic acid export membrane protein